MSFIYNPIAVVVILVRGQVRSVLPLNVVYIPRHIHRTLMEVTLYQNVGKMLEVALL